MKLVIGLGNPGTKYLKNRHNVGQRFVREANVKCKMQNVKFLETDCFMNESGKYVKKYLGDGGNLGDLYVVHDDLDLRLGSYKIQFGVGPKVHYGIASVEQELGDKNFWRIRIGVDNRDPQNRTAGEDYVLEDFTKGELEVLKGVFDAIIKDGSFQN